MDNSKFDILFPSRSLYLMEFIWFMGRRGWGREEVGTGGIRMGQGWRVKIGD